MYWLKKKKKSNPCPFQAFSAYFYTFDFLGLAPRASLSHVNSTIESYCNKTWMTVSNHISQHTVDLPMGIGKAAMFFFHSPPPPFFSLSQNIQRWKRSISEITVVQLIISWSFSSKDTNLRPAGIKSPFKNRFAIQKIIAIWQTP